jgi:hypothetical protein
MHSLLLKRIFPLVVAVISVCTFASGCSTEPGDMAMTHNTRLELVDWHIAGLWVINSPVCWLRVYNYNKEPIHNVTLSYVTYDYDGKPLDKGTYTLDGTVVPYGSKNFIEQYIGLVSIESDKLSIKLESVQRGEQ